ncbi:MAG: polysaccharide pyruvyl transferase family protein, partial [Candidatus Paracaedibacteraceae bacterium]|nr:polysaccharide pyruvyl transferase family protein [Candidatus Paracaedibacteraceae bacterium]
MFDIRFGELFGPLLETAQNLGIKTLLLSTGGINYSPSEISHCREVLKKYPPYILTTRDAETYNNYNDLCERSYNAICSAWFVPEAYPGYHIPDERPYITSCFDHTREPQFSLAFHTTQESPEFSTTRVTHSKLTKITRLLQRNLNDDINGIQIIRPCHQVLNRQNWRLFFKPNSYCSQLPHGYLNLYRNTKLTITDRLHASVATLAYGNPARLFIKSNRTLLLDRVNAQHVGKKIFKMDIDALSNEKEEYQNWLTKALHN